MVASIQPKATRAQANHAARHERPLLTEVNDGQQQVECVDGGVEGRTAARFKALWLIEAEDDRAEEHQGDEPPASEGGAVAIACDSVLQAVPDLGCPQES